MFQPSGGGGHSGESRASLLRLLPPTRPVPPAPSADLSSGTRPSSRRLQSSEGRSL